ncbi:DNA primase [Candidatus Kaiserbacteria bacterium]|nr:DNA primase [Candidatus Kaiserbacteria bacterium]
MGEDDVQKIKDRLSIVDVVSQYVKLERSGANFRARCPFHAERTPSFFVSPDRGTYHCFGCNVGGDIFSFVEQVEGLDFKGALKVLAEKAGVILEYTRGTSRDKDARERLFELLEIATIFYASRMNDAAAGYLRERGISEKTTTLFRLGLAGEGWSDLIDHLKTKKYSERELLEAGIAVRGERGIRDKFRNRIMFPISDSAGRVVGFSGRVFGEHVSRDAPKYLNSPETQLFHKSRILYGLDKAKLAIRKHNCAVLVEGQLDLLASHQAGWGNTVAVSGTAFTGEHGTLIRRLTDNIVIALDPDEAGIKAAGRAARAALQAALNVKVARLPAGLDPADLILKEGKDAWSKAIREGKDIVTFLLDVLEERSKGADWLRRNVEGIVLPYLADVRSPIAREQYIRKIAERLSVSESAVSEALAKMPKTPELSSSEPLRQNHRGTNRAKIAYAILLQQKSLPKTDLDIESYEHELAEAVGQSVMDEFAALPAVEQEKLRFSAESMYAGSSALKAEASALLSVLLRERLSRELAEATAALRRAEVSGNEDEAAVHMSVCNVLTRRIARLHGVL